MNNFEFKLISKRVRVITTKYELKEVISAFSNDKYRRYFNKLNDYSSITNMDYLLFEMKHLTKIPTIKMTNVVSAKGMFRDCSGLEGVCLVDTKNLKDASYIFSNCESLKWIQIDTSSVENFRYMFDGCELVDEEFDLDFTNAKTIKGMYDNTKVELPVCNFIKDDYEITEDDFNDIVKYHNKENIDNDDWFMQDDDDE